MGRNYGEDENDGMAEPRAAQPQQRYGGLPHQAAQGPARLGPVAPRGGPSPARPMSVVERLQQLDGEYREFAEMMHQRCEALGQRVHMLEEELRGQGNGPG